MENGTQRTLLIVWLTRGLMLEEVWVKIVVKLAVKDDDDDDSSARARLTLWLQRAIRGSKTVLFRKQPHMQPRLVSQPPILCTHYVFSRKLHVSANFQAWIINKPLNCRWRADSTLVYFLMTKTICFKCDPWQMGPYLSFLQGEVMEVTDLRTGGPAHWWYSLYCFPPFLPWCSILEKTLH